MSEASVNLAIPENILMRAQQIAQDSEQSVETVLVEGLNLLFGNFSEMFLSPDELQEYSNEQLWAIVYQRLAWPQDTRLRELAALGDLGQISADELDEMEVLIELVDRQMLLRSEALLLLKQRGQLVKSHVECAARKLASSRQPLGVLGVLGG